MTRVAIVTASLFAVPMLAAADPGSGWQGRHEHMMWGGGSGMIGGLIMMLLFWGIVITLIYFVVKWMSDRPGRDSRRDAMDILRERYASGEIDEEEFERRRKVLEA